MEEPVLQSPQTPAEEPEEPCLPNDFFMELLHLPACKSKGYCDNCGRCER